MKTLFALLALTSVASAGYITNAQISGFGTTTITGHAEVDAIFDIVPFAPSASARAAVLAFTAGPMRDGFLEIRGDGFASTGGGSSAVIDGQAFSCLELCFPPLNGAPRAFTLGVPFEIQATASATTLGPPDSPRPGTAFIDFRFSLFEALQIGSVTVPGAPVIVSAIPEPSTWMLVGLSVVGLARFRTRSRHGR